MAKESRWIPLVAVALLICLGAVCVVGVLGGSTVLDQLTGPGEATPTTVAGGLPDGGGDAAQAKTPEPAVTPEEESETSPPSPSSEQVLNLPGGDPPTLDPHLSGDATSAEYVVEIFSGLVTFDQDLNVIPDLAERWEVSDDGIVYTFFLRENARFHNGKPVRAQDFKWSFERACDFRTLSTTADTYLGDIVGCAEKLRGNVDEVEGVQVHRRLHVGDHHRSAARLLPGQANLSHGLCAGPGECGARRAHLDRPAQRHRAVQAGRISFW